MRKPPFHKSVRNAINGLIWILRNERNFQYEILGLLINLFLIVYFRLNTFDTLVILIVCFAVLITEIINTCIEKICDIVQPEYDYRIKIIKDAAAGSVVLSVLSAVAAGILIYPKYIWSI